MDSSPHASPADPPALAEPRRAGRELLLELVFHPLSSVLVPLLARLRAPPPAVVLANAASGLLAAAAIAGGQALAGALLLQVKTLLDNADGQLARSTGRVTLAGRYLDTELDLIVNAALFVALADVTGRPWLALAGFAALTLVLAVDFNVSELAREAHGVPVSAPDASGSRAERVLGLLYRTLFAPQDRAIRALSRTRFRAVVGERVEPAKEAEAQRAYFDALTLTTLSNLGLTTQLAALGVCLVLGVPEAYPILALAGAVLLVPLQLRREDLARKAAA